MPVTAGRSYPKASFLFARETEDGINTQIFHFNDADLSQFPLCFVHVDQRKLGAHQACPSSGTLVRVFRVLVSRYVLFLRLEDEGVEFLLDNDFRLR